MIRHRDSAMAKLARMRSLGEGPPLEPVAGVACTAGLGHLATVVLDRVWVYLANAFTVGGQGLFADALGDNLRIAQDYAIAQIVLPHVFAGRPDDQDRLAVVHEYLSTGFPQASRWLDAQRESPLVRGDLARPAHEAA